MEKRSYRNYKEEPLNRILWRTCLEETVDLSRDGKGNAGAVMAVLARSSLHLKQR